MSKIDSSRLVREHLALKREGVASFAVRQRIISLAHLRAHDFEAWLEARARVSVGELVEMPGERGMDERSSNGKRAFWGALNNGKGALVWNTSAPFRHERLTMNGRSIHG